MAEKPVQLAGIRHLVAVDIYLGSSLAYHLQPVAALDEAGDLAEDIAGSAGILEHGAAHGSSKALSGDPGLWHYGLYHGLAEHFGVFLKPDGGKFHQGVFESHGLGCIFVTDK